MNAIKKLKLALLLILFCPLAFALPKVSVAFGITPDGYTRVRIQNETAERLACYVAIDGFQRKFQLRPKSITGWFKATDKRFTYKNFSTWCDYIDIHPKYKNYIFY